MNCSLRCFFVPMLLPTAWIVGGVGCSNDGSNQATDPAAPDASSRGGAVSKGGGEAPEVSAPEPPEPVGSGEVAVMQGAAAEPLPAGS